MKSAVVPKGDKNLRLDHLRVVNFRCFSELEIAFHQSLTVLVANNGQGKTAILDAIATALGPFVGGFDEGKDCYFERDDIRLIRASGSNRMELADGGIALMARGLIDYHELPWSRELSGPKSRTTRKGASLLTQFAKKLQSQVRREAEGGTSGTCLPIVAYYGTDRLWNIRRLPYKPLPRTSRMVGYTHCLESGSDFHLMAEWFRYWSYASIEHRHKAQQEGKLTEISEADNALEAVRNAINLCLKPSGWGDIDFSLERQEIVARHPQHGELPVGMLSDGIRNMLTLVADIAFRTVKLNPNLGPDAAVKTHGIVLIDEIDMHLHPAWQQTVLSALLEAFPKIQFVVTTHSPQVVSTAPDECVRVIDEGAVHAAPHGTEGAESSRVLKRVFGVDPRPAKNSVAIDLKRYLSLVDQDQWASVEALELRQKLDEAFKGEEPALLEADLLVENKKWELGA
jgi:predicted ATP-binding protein involved in virulence